MTGDERAAPGALYGGSKAPGQECTAAGDRVFAVCPAGGGWASTWCTAAWARMCALPDGRGGSQCLRQVTRQREAGLKKRRVKLGACNVAYARARVGKVRYTKEMLASQAIRTTYSSQATTKKRRPEIFHNS